MMKTNEINIRDPYVLVDNGHYYLYGTRSLSTWGKMDGFDVYVSTDLKNWTGPTEIFHRPTGFWADQNFWAPECYHVGNEYRLITTLGDGHEKSINLLTASSPVGPFTYQGRLTTQGDNCIDGTIYQDKDQSYLVYSHALAPSNEQIMNVMEALPLRNDWRQACGEAKVLFTPDQAPWVKALHDEKIFGVKGDVYLTDGPSLINQADGSLLMLWSSIGKHGYTVGVAKSDSGRLTGKWHHFSKPWLKNGGHGMPFTTLDGHKQYVIHTPNDFTKERPCFIALNLSSYQ